MWHRRSLNLLALQIVWWGCIVCMAAGCVAAQKKPLAASSPDVDRVQVVKNLSHPGDYPYETEIDDIYDGLDDFRDRVVVIKGRFMGWQGNCADPPPVTRSDWMLDQHGRCIYVTGKVALNLDRQRNSPDIGRAVTVRGVILVDPKGNPYVRASSVEVEMK